MHARKDRGELPTWSEIGDSALAIIRRETKRRLDREKKILEAVEREIERRKRVEQMKNQKMLDL